MVTGYRNETTLARGFAFARAVIASVGADAVAVPLVTIEHDREYVERVQFVTLGDDKAATAAKVLAWSEQPVRMDNSGGDVRFYGQSAHGVSFVILASVEDSAKAIVEYGVRVDEPARAEAAAS